MFISIDINECVIDNGVCAQTCTNTLGSFTCSCSSGYILDTDNRSCNGKFPDYVAGIIL